MATAEERRKILEMVAGGKISAGEAAELLGSMPREEVEPEAPQAPEPPAAPDAPEAVPATKVPTAGGGSPRWLHVQVSDLKSGKRKVSVNIPLRLVKFGMKLGRGFAPELDELDWASLSDTLASGEGGVLVDVQDEEDGEHVKIYVD